MSPDPLPPTVALHPTVAAMLRPFTWTHYAKPVRVQVEGEDCIHCGCPDQTDAPCEGCAALDELADRYAASQQEPL